MHMHLAVRAKRPELRHKKDISPQWKLLKKYYLYGKKIYTLSNSQNQQCTVFFMGKKCIKTFC